MRKLLSVAVLSVLLMGCETGEEQRSATAEVLLAAAGFEVKVADRPERQSHLESLTQRQIVRHQHNGEALYVYANARACDCLYAGTEANYERYRALARSSRARGVQRLDAVAASPGSNLNWALWTDAARPTPSQ